MARGFVKFFKPDKGWGAITSDALPEGSDAWVHFSVIESDGYRALDAGDVGLRVAVGGGLGRTPIVGHVIRAFLPRAEILNYLDAILRVYNRHGRRDNKWKARIKILVRDLGPAGFAEQVEAEWQHLRDGSGTVPREELARIEQRFGRPRYEVRQATSSIHEAALRESIPYARWVGRNVHPHRAPGYAAVTVSLKRAGVPPGDTSADEMDAIAQLSESFGFGELRVTHEQNLILPDVRLDDLPQLWQRLRERKLATPNIGLLTNIISCPGGDYCALANAVSIPVADAIQRRFDDLDYLHDIGELDLNISGCINACGHHHVGHIGVLGVDKSGEEWYQITIGGSQGPKAAIGRIIGPSFSRDQIPDVVAKLIECHLVLRASPQERFVDVVHRVGIQPFRDYVYGNTDRAPKAGTESLAHS